MQNTQTYNSSFQQKNIAINNGKSLNKELQNFESPGAVTLERSIVKNSSNAVYMEKQIYSWVSAIKRGYKKPEE